MPRKNSGSDSFISDDWRMALSNITMFSSTADHFNTVPVNYGNMFISSL